MASMISLYNHRICFACADDMWVISCKLAAAFACLPHLGFENVT